jgi:hypothetical protein
MKLVTVLMGTAVALLGLTWLLFSNEAPIGLAFLLTGICLVSLTFRKD